MQAQFQLPCNDRPARIERRAVSECPNPLRSQPGTGRRFGATLYGRPRTRFRTRCYGGTLVGSSPILELPMRYTRGIDPQSNRDNAKMKYLRPSIGLLAAVACLASLARPAAAQCEFCSTDAGAPDAGTFDQGTPPGGGLATGCWVEESATDRCVTPPAVCPPDERPQFTFLDNKDGNENGQIYTRGDREPFVNCGTLRVSKTGYYRIFDTELSESCTSQRDETGYLTITNSCNNEGWALEANNGRRYLVLDSDNTPACDDSDECDPGRVCRTGNTGDKCCVPENPTFMGTFLLVAGEDNEICLRHWCPEWEEAEARGEDLGFVTAGCRSADSIHFRIDQNAIACEEDTSLNACTFGCLAGQCQSDPCDSANCPAFCRDGICLPDNPCDGLACEHGCKNGRCLQPKGNGRGTDVDGDGYFWTADCNDNDRLVNPGREEICNNAIDDDCDGQSDESDCQISTSGSDAGSLSSADAGGGSRVGGNAGGGCDCRVGSAPKPVSLLLLVLLLHRRRRRGIR